MRYLIALFILLSIAPSASAADLKAGVGVVDITPPLGWRMSGYFNERLSTGLHDPLHAKAIVLEQPGGAACAFVFCDLIGVTRPVVVAARNAASRETGIPTEAISIAGTHTHTGPLYDGVLREHFHKTAIEKNGRDPCEPLDYDKFLAEKIAQAIVQAHARIRPAVLRMAVVEQKPPLGFNRRFVMKDGSVVFNPGQQNPNIVRPAGPSDQRVYVLVVDGSDGKPFAALTNYAMHLDTTGGTLYSADYPYYLEQALRAEFGTDFVSLFGTGPCGDINHVDVSVKTRRSAEELGKMLAETVRRAIREARPVSGKMGVRTATVTLALQTCSPEDVEQAREQMKLVGTEGLPFLKQVRACKILGLASRGSKVEVEVKAFRLGGDVALVALPSEIFTELSLAIKKASGFKNTLVVELSNDSLGYIPTRKAIEEGSYETVNSLIQPGGGEMLVDSAIKMLKELAAQ